MNKVVVTVVALSDDNTQALIVAPPPEEWNPVHTPAYLYNKGDSFISGPMSFPFAVANGYWNVEPVGGPSHPCRLEQYGFQRPPILAFRSRTRRDFPCILGVQARQARLGLDGSG